MVKDTVKKMIRERLDALCEARGVPANLDIVDYMDNLCIVVIPKDVSNAKMDALKEICAELEKVDGVRDIWHKGKDRVLKGADRGEFQITVKDGFWTRTEADKTAEKHEMRKLFDDDYAAKERKKEEAERRKHWKEYLIELPKPDGSSNDEVFLTMAYDPYDWIDKGYDEDGKHLYKRTEFRAYNEYYMKKLMSHPIRRVKLQRGYGGLGRPKPSQMVWEVVSITLYDSKSKMECAPEKPTEGIIPDFFAINLGKRIS